MVFQWKDCRPEFSDISTFRVLVSQSVPIFGCTATLDKECQQYVLEHAGFRQRSGGRALEIVRTTVDRPDIAVVVLPIPRGIRSKDYRRLDFIFSGAKPHAPEDIPKTIIYIASKRGICQCRECMR